MKYRTSITVLPEGTDEFGNASGRPEVPECCAAVIVGAERVLEDGSKEFLVRARCLPEMYPMLEADVPFIYEEESLLRDERPELWTAFGMDPYTTTQENEEGVEEEVTVTPSIPVFL